MWDQSALDAIRPDLASEERVLWAGRPGRGVGLRWGYLAQIPFFLAWTGFAVFWEGTVILTGGPWCMALFGLPFVLLGIHMLIGRFVLDVLDRRRTVYAVTSKRILVVRPGLFGRTLLHGSLRDVLDVKPSLKPDGRGILTFQARNPASWLTEVSAWSAIGRFLESQLLTGRMPMVSFEMIPDAKEVSVGIERARGDLLAAEG